MSRKQTLTAATMLVFIVMNFVSSMSGALFSAILDQVALELGISVSQAGSLSSFYAYGAGIGVPVFLVLFHKYDRSMLLKAMLLLNIAVTAFLTIAGSFSSLLAARFLMGLSSNCYAVLATATIAALSPEEKVGRNLSVLIAGSASALMIGIPLTRALAKILPWRNVFMILIGLMLLSLVYFIFRLPSAGSDRKPVHLKDELEFLKDKSVVIQLLLSMVTFIGYGGFYMYLTPYITEQYAALEPYMSLILVLVGACSFAGNMLGGYVCDRAGYKKALLAGSLVQLLTASLMFVLKKAMIPSLVLVLLWMVNGWFIGLQINTGITIVTKNRSSLMISLNSSGIQLGQAVGASIAAVIISSSGIGMISLLSIVCSAAAAGILLFTEKKA